MSKLGDYLKKHKVDVRRVVAVSRHLEALQPEDRAIKMARVRVKAGADTATDALKEQAAKKVRSGRSLSRVALDRVLADKPVTRKSRARIVRAVSALVSKKSKGGEVKAQDLF